MASTVKGLDKLLRQLKALPVAVKAAAAEALKQNADDLAEKIRSAAPSRSGALKRSVRAVSGAAPSGALGSSSTDRSDVLAGEGLTVSVIAGDDAAYYARFVEFGTAASPAGRYRDAKGKTRVNKTAHKATRAQPFFYPTIRAQKTSLKSRIVRAGSKAAKAAASAT